MTAAEMAGNCVYCVMWALLGACRTTNAFNVDVSTASLRQGADDSMFGFTVAQHVDHGQNWSVQHRPTGGSRRCKGDMVHILAPYMPKGGTLFQCSTNC